MGKENGENGSGTATLSRTRRKSKSGSGKIQKSSKGGTSLTKAGAKYLSKKNLGRVAMGVGIGAATLAVGNVAYRMYKGVTFSQAIKQSLGFGAVEVEA